MRAKLFAERCGSDCRISCPNRCPCSVAFCVLPLPNKLEKSPIISPRFLFAYFLSFQVPSLAFAVCGVSLLDIIHMHAMEKMPLAKIKPDQETDQCTGKRRLYHR